MEGSRLKTDVVRALLLEQHPDLAHLELRKVDGRWANEQWRLGEELAVRLPRTEQAAALLLTEQTWLPMLAERLPLPTPTPVRIGKPSELSEHPWTIARWVEGEPADRSPITRPEATVELARFMKVLHQEAPADAPTSPTRGVPLAGLERILDRWFHLIAEHPHADAVRELWETAVSAPAWQGPPLWLHGDLHPANVIASDGTLAGVIDFGDICSGDPAWDLTAAWILLPAGEATRFLRRLSIGRRCHHHPSPWLGCPAGASSNRGRAKRQARPAWRQTDVGTGRLRHARTSSYNQLTRRLQPGSSAAPSPGPACSHLTGWVTAAIQPAASRASPACPGSRHFPAPYLHSRYPRQEE